MTIWDQPDAAAYSSRDRIAKRIEIEAIARYVKDGMMVLDVGCGDGETLVKLARQFALSSVTGIDFSPQMIALAEWNPYRSGMKTQSVTQIFVADIAGDIPEPQQTMLQGFDLVYTQRCLINLPNWEAQKKAIGNIAQTLKPGGLYVMLENSWEGLQAINDLREAVGLPRIEPPSHNRYLRDGEIADLVGGIYWEPDWGEYQGAHPYKGLSLGSFEYPAFNDYSSTYYYLSRVVNAALAVQEGKEPEYDSPINRLALSLPPIAGLRGQGRIWVWRKA